MLKVGIVGVGGISVAHLNAWKTIEGAEVVALCDIRRERLDEHTDKRCYLNFEEMLENETLDILDVCVPTFLHIEYSIKAMNKGINVICEKPISLKREDVKLAYETAEKNGVKFMVAQVVRFAEEFNYVKEVFESKKYGKLLSGTMKRLGIYPYWTWENWMMKEKLSGLVPYDLHIHDLDFLVYAFGKPNVVTTKRARTPDADYLNVIYDYDGFFIAAEASWYAAPYPFQFGFKFQFKKALITLEDGKLNVYENEGKILDLTPGNENANETGEIGLPVSDAYANEIRYFVECVNENKPTEKVKREELETVIDILNII